MAIRSCVLAFLRSCGLAVLRSCGHGHFDWNLSDLQVGFAKFCIGGSAKSDIYIAMRKKCK